MKLSMFGSIALVGCVLTSLLLPFPTLAKSYGGELPPEETAAFQRSCDLVAAGDSACRIGDYAEGEKDYKAAKVVWDWNLSADRGLAEALVGEGRYSEAVEVYRALLAPNPVVSGTITQETRTLMGFAIALNRDGQWEEAVSVYERELPNTTHYFEAPKIEVHFNPYVPRPAQFDAVAHISIGIACLHNSPEDAFLEFTKAMQDDPTSAYSNYYYGYGWQELSPEERAKLGMAQQAKAASQKAGMAQQAKAALQKAVKIGNVSVKAAAEKALKSAG